MLPFKFIENPLIPESLPHYRLAPGDYIGAEFRARMDAWCDEFFGRYAPIVFVQPGVGMAAPKIVGLIRAEVQREESGNG